VKSDRHGKLPILAAVVGALVLMVLSRCLVPDVVYPLERAWLLASRTAWPRLTGFFRAASVAAENESLRREVATLKLQQADLARLEAENGRLRRALDFRERHSKKWVYAGVLSSGGGALGVRDVLRIDKGSLAGVRADAAVVVPEGLVGRVTSVSECTAEVTLLTDSSVRVACEVESGSAHVRGILCGGSDDRLVLLHLRNAGAVPPHSRVLTSGLGGVFPRGLEVGVLLAVTNGVRGVEGEVRPKVDYSTLEDVFVCCDR